jgi:hypothetical protein
MLYTIYYGGFLPYFFFASFTPSSAVWSLARMKAIKFNGSENVMCDEAQDIPNLISLCFILIRLRGCAV